MKSRNKQSIFQVFSLNLSIQQKLPIFVAAISAGFPSPADDYIDKKLDLNELLVRHPSATFFVRVSGNSMTGAGINSGDILIVDRALEPSNNHVVIAILNGEMMVKRMRKEKGRVFLVPEHPDYEIIEMSPETQFEIWGVVSHVIHQV